MQLIYYRFKTVGDKVGMCVPALAQESWRGDIILAKYRWCAKLVFKSYEYSTNAKHFHMYIDL